MWTLDEGRGGEHSPSGEEEEKKKWGDGQGWGLWIEEEERRGEEEGWGHGWEGEGWSGEERRSDMMVSW